MRRFPTPDDGPEAGRTGVAVQDRLDAIVDRVAARGGLTRSELVGRALALFDDPDAAPPSPRM